MIILEGESAYCREKLLWFMSCRIFLLHTKLLIWIGMFCFSFCALNKVVFWLIIRAGCICFSVFLFFQFRHVQKNDGANPSYRLYQQLNCAHHGKHHEVPTLGLYSLWSFTDRSFPVQTQWTSLQLLSLMKARQQWGETEKLSLLYFWSICQGLWDLCKVSYCSTYKGYFGWIISSDSQCDKLPDSPGSFS